ncbi:hypothetical protein [Halanaerobium congolense]|uniref:hypothetical protein n=1 Tax=Halanaerobium congolense TaxID=54121 RepID=UPI00105DE4EF|nr:hypothetical protein [Halanaerobium congolense]TDP26390.1 hypothetical protein C8C79_104108 [Halanaerobium congolense]
MKIFLDDKLIGEEFNDMNLPEIFNKIQNSLEDRILKAIFVNDVEVNEKYLKESLVDKDQINKIEFSTQKTSSLINETLDEANEYLPKLRKGTQETASLFRNSDDKAVQNYQLILNGLEWYIEALSQITSLINNEDYYQQGQNMINEINKTLSDLMIAYNKEDFVLVADILEYEIVDIVEDLIEFNDRLIKITE